MKDPLLTYEKNNLFDEGEEEFVDYDFYNNEDDENMFEPNTEEVLEDEPGLEFEFIDELFNDIDFSQFKGDFKSSLKKLDSKIRTEKPKIRKVVKKKKPLSQEIGVKNKAVLHGNGTDKTASRIIVPRNRKVIVEGINKFMLTDNAEYKNIGYYKGEKLRELILIFNNSGSNDFTIEIFNPSAPLDYLFSTSGNLNNKIQVAAGNTASYSDVLYNLLANPAFIPNARFVVNGPSVQAQLAESLQFINKNIEGKQFVNPININQELDTLQFQSNVITFDIYGNLSRPYVPDGMDVINYTVLAGMTVTMCFYYKQKMLKDFFFEECKKSKNLLK